MYFIRMQAFFFYFIILLFFLFYYFYHFFFFNLLFGVSAGKRDQIEIFFKKKFLSKIDVDLIIWSRTFIISKKNFLSIWSLFPALTPFDFSSLLTVSDI